jgi:hypothetical protein
VRKLILLLTIVYSSEAMWAQIPLIFSDDFPESAKMRVGITADYDLNSNCITSAMLSKFYKGGYIDDGIKKPVLGRLKNKNRIGGNYSSGIYVAFKPDSIFHNKRHLSFFVSIRDRFHVDSHFPGDLFKLGFNGNAQFAGQTAYLSNFNLNMLRYQQFQIGLFSSNLDSVARWGIGLSFLKGQDYLSIDAKKAELYTSEDGQYLDLNTELYMAKSDTAHKGLGAFNGYGASVDIYFEAPFKTRIGDAKIKVSVSDIGTIHYNQQTIRLKEDTILHYSGIYVNNLNSIQNSDGSNAKDSLFNSMAHLTKGGYSATLPAVLDVTYTAELNKRFQLIKGIRYVFNANYSLLGYLKVNYYFNPRFMLSASVGHGGYGGEGRFNFGLNVFANFKNGVVVYAGSNNLEGYFAPKTRMGQGVYVSLVKNFK